MTGFFKKNHFIVLLAFFLACGPAIAGSYTVEKVIDNGDDSKKFVWVVLAEGYTAPQQDKFNEDAGGVLETFFTCSPFMEYKAAINVYTVFIASDEPGADNPSEGRYVDTAFDATYDTYGISRLLTVNETKAFGAAAQVPQFDVVFVLVNDEEYGGSGGSVIAFSVHEAASEIALHEAGHVIGKLADEYETPYPGYPEGDWEPNVTFADTRERVPWKDWIDPETPVPTSSDLRKIVGLYEGARYLPGGIYRPTHTSKMRSLNQPFYEVNTEALILNIYSYVSPIQGFSPADTSVELAAGTPAAFSVETLGMVTCQVLWEADGNLLEGGDSGTLVLYPAMLKKGTSTLTVWVSDATGLVRVDAEGLATARYSWQVSKGFCSGSVAGVITDAQAGGAVSDAAIIIEETGEEVAPDGQGAFSFADIACGEYTVTVESPGYAVSGQTAVVRDGAASRLAFNLDPAAGSYYISGSVSGAPAELITIAIDGVFSRKFAPATDGSFNIGPLPAGEYTLTPLGAGYRFRPFSKKVSLTDKSLRDIIFSGKRALFPSSQLNQNAQ